jgi:hypothetical protein
MSQKFSSDLIDRIIAYFANGRGAEITKEQAEEYLNSLADLYLVMSKK